MVVGIYSPEAVDQEVAVKSYPGDIWPQYNDCHCGISIKGHGGRFVNVVPTAVYYKHMTIDGNVAMQKEMFKVRVDRA